MRFRKPMKLGVETASWLRHEGRVCVCTAATCLYFRVDLAGLPKTCDFSPLLSVCRWRSAASWRPLLVAVVVESMSMMRAWGEEEEA